MTRRASDLVLKRVAEVLGATVRDVDLVARIGGEEFGVLLPSTGEAGALAVADGLRHALERALASDASALTASCGVATAGEYPAADTLMRAADTTLYAAKQLGRNRSVASRPHLSAMVRFELDDALGEPSPLRTMLALSEALDVRDGGTATHSRTVGHHAELMASALGFTPRRTARVRLAGLLHDVGRSACQTPRCARRGRWTPRSGRRCARTPRSAPGCSDPWSVTWASGCSHTTSAWTGRTTHAGSASEIPIEARILAVAAAYEAMTADRPYRVALGREAAAQELLACSGTQFDPHVVETFLRALAEQALPEPVAAPT